MPARCKASAWKLHTPLCGYKKSLYNRILPGRLYWWTNKPTQCWATLPGWHCQLGPPGPPPCWVWKQWVAWWMAPGAGKQAGSHPAAPSALQGGVEAGSWVHCWAVLEPGAAAAETADPPAGSWWGRWWGPGAGSCQGPGKKKEKGHLCWCDCRRHSTTPSSYRLPKPR